MFVSITSLTSLFHRQFFLSFVIVIQSSVNVLGIDIETAGEALTYDPLSVSVLYKLLMSMFTITLTLVTHYNLKLLGTGYT